MLIEVALNGNRSRGEHAAIPQSPEELAAEARAAVEAGAGAVHFHVYDAYGRESIDSEDVARAVESMRSAIPNVLFGLSTGDWILRDAAKRHRKVAEWEVLPPFISINFNEDGAAELAKLALDRGIGIEAGIGSEEAAVPFLASGLAGRCIRVMYEPEQQDFALAVRVVDRLESMLTAERVTIPRLIHGYNATAWRMVDEARRRGWDTRIGFEDVVTLPNGEVAVSNRELVSEAKRRMHLR